MSARSDAVTKRHFSYLAERTHGDDEFLATLKKSAQAEGIPGIWIAPEQASFLQILMKLQNARTVVEVGTLVGYSAISMARALPPDGKVHTLEVHPQCVSFARKWVARSDVADKVEVHEGDARTTLKVFSPNSIDAVFLDADKTSYGAYVEEASRILRPGGLLLVDNAFAFGGLLDESRQEPEIRAIREFNDTFAARSDFHGIIIPIGDGCWMAVKRG